jgi:hypothetical protein
MWSYTGRSILCRNISRKGAEKNTKAAKISLRLCLTYLLCVKLQLKILFRQIFLTKMLAAHVQHTAHQVFKFYLSVNHFLTDE